VTALADRTWPELHDVELVLAVPLGATEQHGPHLPLSTDTDIACALANGLAREAADVVVAPPLAYGASGEHQSFAGTLSIGQRAVELVLVELVRSATETFRRVVLVSAHGGNKEPVTRAVCRLRAEDRDVRAWSPAGHWCGDAHAGRVETSVMLALDPGRVRSAAAGAGDARPLRELLPALRAGGVAAVSANGVLGDPEGANPGEGEALLRRGVAALTAAVRAWPADGPDWL
jgi:creatinine amidohydrolase